MTHTFHIKGNKLRSASNRRFIAVVGRAKAFTTTESTGSGFKDGQYQVFVQEHRVIDPYVTRRSDNFETVKKAAEKAAPRGGYAIVIDQASGEQHVIGDWTAA